MHVEQRGDTILGGATDVVTTGWPSVFRGSDRMLTLETRIPFSSFGSGVPESLHVGFDATRGVRNSASVELAGGPFGGDIHYYKPQVTSAVYFPTFWKFVLSVAAPNV